MRPGTVYRVEINLNSVAWYFKPGHRLRLYVTSADFPMYDRNLNTGGDNVTENQVGHRPQHRTYGSARAIGADPAGRPADALGDRRSATLTQREGGDGGHESAVVAIRRRVRVSRACGQVPPAIICCAANGGVQGKESSPALPETADEIADSVYGAYRAGASMVHVHARERARPTHAATRTETWLEVNRKIRERCPDIIDQRHHGRRPRHDDGGAPPVSAGATGGRIARTSRPI